MYKKVLSAILFGALTIASTSTFVSCKDYDDDIKSLQTRIDANDTDNAALHTALTALETKVADLKTQLEQKDAELAVLIQKAQSATEENKAAIQAERNRAVAAEAALEARIATAETAIAELKTLITALENNKVDKTEFNTKVQDIYAKIEAVEANLGSALTQIASLSQGLQNEETARKAAVADLQQQINALNAYTARIQTLEGNMGTAQSSIGTLTTNVGTLTSELSTQAAALSGNSTDIETLKTKLSDLSNKVDEIAADVNTLNVLLMTTLRSIVFIPDFYYWGIEGTQVNGVYENYFKFSDIDEVSADVADPSWTNGANTDCWYYGNQKIGVKVQTKFVVENFVARYHLNPSNADLSKATINILQGDRDYITRAAATDSKNTNIVVKNGYKPAENIKNGDLYVYLNITDPKKIKSNGHIETKTEAGATQRHYVQDASETEQVTVFAAEVVLGAKSSAAQQDTTVTSDYAVLRQKTYANGYRLAHTKTGDPAIKAPLKTGSTSGSYTGVQNMSTTPLSGAGVECGTCGGWGTAHPADHCHLFTDADETVFNLDAQIKDLKDQPLVQARNGASSTTTAQDVVVWNTTINLSKLVEVHRIGNLGVSNNESLVSAADLKANNCEIRFELTGLFTKDNKTSESAHAAIQKDANGDYILRPQLPKMQYQADGQNVGKAAAWGETNQDRTTVGRTPLVRVLLVNTGDADDANDDVVVDYGYIRLVIIDEVPEVQTDVWTIPYVTGINFDYKYYNYQCTQPASAAKSWTQKWGSFEHDLYNLANQKGRVSLSQVEFENKYDSVLLSAVGSSFDFSKMKYATYTDAGAYAQYKVKETVVDGVTNYTFTPCTESQYVGLIRAKEDDNGIGDGTLTQVITWTITAKQMRDYTVVRQLNTAASRANKDFNNEGYLNGDKSVDLTRAIKFEVVNPLDRSTLRDIYVILKAGPAKIVAINDKPVASVKFDTNKIKEYWYDDNTQKTQNTLKEAHLNVPSPEDWKLSWQDGALKPFEFLLSSDFDENEIVADLKASKAKFDKFVTVTNDPMGDYVYNKLNKYDLEFHKANDGKEYVGLSGTWYRLSRGAKQIWNGTAVENKANWALLAAKLTAKGGNTVGQPDTIAYLEYEQTGINDIDNINIVLKKKVVPYTTGNAHLNSYAEDLLNYVRHDNLGAKATDNDDDALRALIGIRLDFVCATLIPEEYIQVRFLRPINLESEDKQVQDAANTTQIIPLYDLVKFTDWRDQWNPTTLSEVNKARCFDDNTTFWQTDPVTGKTVVDYWYYYNVKEIHVGGKGLAAIDVLDNNRSLNSYMTTNLNGNNLDTKKLSSISANVEFKYLKPTLIEEEHNDPDDPEKVTGTHTSVIGEPHYYGSIQYTNNRSTVDNFKVKVPVTVCYEWGSIDDYIIIDIRKTLNNTDVKRQ